MGVVATLFNYGVYSVCILFTTPAISMLIATVLATILNYFMTTSFTFRVKRNVKNGIGFIITHLINLALNEAFLFLFLFLGDSERPSTSSSSETSCGASKATMKNEPISHLLSHYAQLRTLFRY